MRKDKLWYLKYLDQKEAIKKFFIDIEIEFAEAYSEPFHTS